MTHYRLKSYNIFSINKKVYEDRKMIARLVFSKISEKGSIELRGSRIQIDHEGRGCHKKFMARVDDKLIARSNDPYEIWMMHSGGEYGIKCDITEGMYVVDSCFSSFALMNKGELVAKVRRKMMWDDIVVTDPKYDAIVMFAVWLSEIKRNYRNPRGA